MASRRTLLKGAAWAAPTAVVATAAPAFAASTEPTVSGSLLFRHQGDGYSRSRAFITTDRPNLGLRVSNSPQRPTSATIDLYVMAVAATASWTGTSDGWSAPQYVRTEGEFTIWRLTFEQPWRQDGLTWHAGKFTFQAPGERLDRAPQVRIIRSAVVNGVTYVNDGGFVRA